MKSVLISIRPKWCEKIASGKKTIEVRKTRPICETPFRCFLYCTQGKDIKFWIGRKYSYADDRSRNAFDVCGNETVIGEFICNAIDAERANNGVQTYYNIPNGTCLTDEQLIKYAAGKTLYLWHISDLKIYDKPKELSEFHKPCTPECNFSEECGGTTQRNCLFALSRPPQSWCYVEEAEVKGYERA